MTNSLVHTISVDDRHIVETVQQLIEALNSVGGDDNLDATYVVELLSEELSDKSIAYSIRIRLAESVI